MAFIGKSTTLGGLLAFAVLLASAGPALAQSSGDLRLSDGNWHSQGRLEIFLNGSWGTVCDDNFGGSDAVVACRQLGYSGGEVRYDSHFGPGTGPIHMTDVRCLRSDSKLTDCLYRRPTGNSCHHNEDVSVICGARSGAPSVVSVERHDGQSAFDRVTSADEIKFRVTFSEAVVNVDASDFTVLAGSVTGVSGSGEVYIVTVGGSALASHNGEIRLVFISSGDIENGDGEALALPRPSPNESYLLENAAAPVAEVKEPETIEARFEDVPDHHNGRPFGFMLHFNEEPDITGAGLKNSILSVTGGRILSIGRHVRGSTLSWSVRVRPAGRGDVRIVLPATDSCDAEGAVCGKGDDSLRLAAGLEAVVGGALALSVHDASVAEGPGAALDFRVTLNRAASESVTVRAVTRDGTAKKRRDYTPTRRNLTFAPGETEKTVSVPVLDDAHDEGSETMILKLVKPNGALVANGTATGTISNSDPLQKEWLARFGRTVASQTVEALEGRLALGPGVPSHMTVAGRHIDFSGAPVQQPSPGRQDSEARGMELRELMPGSSFHFTTGSASGLGAVTGWGKALTGRSDSTLANGLSLASETATGVLGMDWEHDGLLVGMALTQTVESGGARFAQSDYDIDGSLTMVAPYARIRASERLSFWSLIGSGQGDMTVSHDGSRQRASIAMQLVAAGSRMDLLRPEGSGGFGLALRTDAFFARTESESVSTPGVGNLAGAAGNASRVRAVLEGSRSFALAGGGAVEPTLRVGLRHDGGDADTGDGVEVGAGLRWSDPAAGLRSELRVHGLAAHEAGGYGEWGVSGFLRLAPDPAGRGLSLSMTPSWGADRGDRLWNRNPTAFVAEDGERTSARLDTEVGYGVGMPDGSTGTPYVGLGLGNRRDYRLGWRMTSDRVPGFSTSLEMATTEAANDNAEHNLLLHGALRW